MTPIHTIRSDLVAVKKSRNRGYVLLWYESHSWHCIIDAHNNLRVSSEDFDLLCTFASQHGYAVHIDNQIATLSRIRKYFL